MNILHVTSGHLLIVVPVLFKLVSLLQSMMPCQLSIRPYLHARFNLLKIVSAGTVLETELYSPDPVNEVTTWTPEDCKLSFPFKQSSI